MPGRPRVKARKVAELAAEAAAIAKRLGELMPEMHRRWPRSREPDPRRYRWLSAETTAKDAAEAISVLAETLRRVADRANPKVAESPNDGWPMDPAPADPQRGQPDTGTE